jgi:hypothetical protein
VHDQTTPNRFVPNGRADSSEDRRDCDEGRVERRRGRRFDPNADAHAATLDHQAIAHGPHAVREAREQRAHRRINPPGHHVRANVFGEWPAVDNDTYRSARWE